MLAWGSNLGKPYEQVTSATASLANCPELEVLDVSRWFGSKAVGPGNQPDYVNGVIKLATSLSALSLLKNTAGC